MLVGRWQVNVSSNTYVYLPVVSSTDEYVSSYSDLKLFTGLVVAAFIDWKLIVNNVISITATAAVMKI